MWLIALKLIFLVMLAVTFVVFLVWAVQSANEDKWWLVAVWSVFALFWFVLTVCLFHYYFVLGHLYYYSTHPTYNLLTKKG